MIKEEVQKVIDEIRPMIKMDGGDIELVDVSEQGVVRVKLQGACAGCPGAAMTLKFGVEKILKQKVPGIKQVELAQESAACG